MLTGPKLNLNDEEREELADELSRIPDKALYFIIRNPWRYSSDVVQECELLAEGVMGCGAASFIRDLTEEELYIEGE